MGCLIEIIDYFAYSQNQISQCNFYEKYNYLFFDGRNSNCVNRSSRKKRV
jgi:hypothetical protein